MGHLYVTLSTLTCSMGHLYVTLSTLICSMGHLYVTLSTLTCSMGHLYVTPMYVDVNILVKFVVKVHILQSTHGRVMILHLWKRLG